jgi:hypothetical protein
MHIIILVDPRAISIPHATPTLASSYTIHMVEEMQQQERLTTQSLANYTCFGPFEREDRTLSDPTMASTSSASSAALFMATPNPEAVVMGASNDENILDRLKEFGKNVIRFVTRVAEQLDREMLPPQAASRVGEHKDHQIHSNLEGTRAGDPCLEVSEADSGIAEILESDKSTEWYECFSDAEGIYGPDPPVPKRQRVMTAPVDQDVFYIGNVHQEALMVAASNTASEDLDFS